MVSVPPDVDREGANLGTACAGSVASCFRDSARIGTLDRRVAHDDRNRAQVGVAARYDFASIAPGRRVSSVILGSCPRTPALECAMRGATGSQEGDVLRGDFWLAPGKAGALDHINPLFDEHCTVVSGTAEFRLGDRRWPAAAGEHAVLPAGVVHNFRNAGSDELHVYVEGHPVEGQAGAGEYREFLDAVFERGGRTTSRGLPLNPLRLAVIQARYPDAIYLARVPKSVQRAATKPGSTDRPGG
jgi:quercetin dioxygenase-like cupin family protein